MTGSQRRRPGFDKQAGIGAVSIHGSRFQVQLLELAHRSAPMLRSGEAAFELEGLLLLEHVVAGARQFVLHPRGTPLSALPESQYQAFRKLFLGEFGRDGLERELERIVAEESKDRNR